MNVHLKQQIEEITQRAGILEGISKRMIEQDCISYPERLAIKKASTDLEWLVEFIEQEMNRYE